MFPCFLLSFSAASLTALTASFVPSQLCDIHITQYEVQYNNAFHGDIPLRLSFQMRCPEPSPRLFMTCLHLISNIILIPHTAHVASHPLIPLLHSLSTGYFSQGPIYEKLFFLKFKVSV